MYSSRGNGGNLDSHQAPLTPSPPDILGLPHYKYILFAFQQSNYHLQPLPNNIKGDLFLVSGALPPFLGKIWYGSSK